MSELNLEGLTAEQLRLFAVRCARRSQLLVRTYPDRRFILGDIRSTMALDVAERHAKGDATDEELAAASIAAECAAKQAHERANRDTMHAAMSEEPFAEPLALARARVSEARACIADAAMFASRVHTLKNGVASSALATAMRCSTAATLVAEANTAHKSNLSSWTAGREAGMAEEAAQQAILDSIRRDGIMIKKNVEKSQTESAARRERIATVVLGMIAQTGRGYAAGSAREAVEFADALIEELDKEKQ